MTSDRRLGEYLRARRAALQPEAVGLGTSVGTRRVEGLRRQEVAVLAGVSTDYYLRLEQGRAERPSDQVLEALARALRLDASARAYLYVLARPPRPAPDVDDSALVQRAQTLIASWPTTIAVIHDRYVEVRGSNRLARLYDPNFQRGRNSVLSLFDRSEQLLHGDGWEGLAGRSVALLRAMADLRAGDEHLAALAAEGSSRSEVFRAMWERRDVKNMGRGVHEVTHPVVGSLTLNYEHLTLAGGTGHTIFTYFADPGSPSATALERLAAAG